MRLTARLVSVISIGSFFFAPLDSALATTIGVTTTADEYGAGATCSLREAIQASNADAPFGGCPAGSGSDVITLPAGTYLLSIPGSGEDANATGDLDITSDVSMRGAGTARSVIDAAEFDRVLDVDPAASGASVSVSELTIRGGMTTGPSDQDGGGIRNQGALTLSRLLVTQNSSGDDGGGVESGGSTAMLVVTDSAIVGNTAAAGGGGETGGGFRNDENATSTLTNVTVSGNVADQNGGGILNHSGTVTLNNVTVTANTADANSDGDGNGGGMELSFLTAVTNLKNTIVARNTDSSPGGFENHPDCSLAITTQGHNLIGDSTGCTLTPSTGDQVGTGAAPINPILGPLADNGGPTMTHALLPGSPAIDAGDPAGCPTTDQRGAPRSACDIGAYELVNCFKRPVIEVGTVGNDVMTGTGAPEVFLALCGGDKVNGKGGGDRVCGGKGKDTLRGGAGKDRLAGEQGKDTCIGGGGRDRARSCEKERTIP